VSKQKNEKALVSSERVTYESMSELYVMPPMSASSPACVSIAPFGTPVVPEVKQNMAMSVALGLCLSSAACSTVWSTSLPCLASSPYARTDSIPRPSSSAFAPANHSSWATSWRRHASCGLRGSTGRPWPSSSKMTTFLRHFASPARRILSTCATFGRPQKMVEVSVSSIWYWAASAPRVS